MLKYRKLNINNTTFLNIDFLYAPLLKHVLNLFMTHAFVFDALLYYHVTLLNRVPSNALTFVLLATPSRSGKLMVGDHALTKGRGEGQHLQHIGCNLCDHGQTIIFATNYK